MHQTTQRLNIKTKNIKNDKVDEKYYEYINACLSARLNTGGKSHRNPEQIINELIFAEW